MKLFLLLGQRRYGSDAEKLLWHICRSYSLTRDNFVLDKMSPFHYCYNTTPASRIVERMPNRDIRMRQIITMWQEARQIEPFQIVGFGWAACDMLFKVGKSKTKTRIGAKWIMTYPGISGNSAWLTYDPAAALFDPNLVVPISWVLVHAANESGIKTTVNTNLDPFDWKDYL